MENETYIKRLKDRLQIEFKKQDRSGVYGFTLHYNQVHTVRSHHRFV